jgi:multidrug efflux pump
VATVTGALPLMFASGAGSASRGAIGVVVVFGVLLSTLLSLFVVPAFYLLLARYTHAPEERARALEAMAVKVPSVDSSHGG